MSGFRDINGVGSFLSGTGKVCTIPDDEDFTIPKTSGGSVHANHVTELRTITGDTTDKRSATLGGHTDPGDGGGGTFFWDDSSSTGDNGGTIIVPTGSSTGRWVRIWSGRVNVKWFGATGDGTTDDTAAIQAAIDVTTESKVVEFPQGQYRVVPPDATSAALEIVASNAILEGIGSSAWPVAAGTAPTIIVDAPSPSGGVGILIERVIYLNTSDQCAVKNLNFVSGSNAPMAFVVVHSQQVLIDTCSFNCPLGAGLGRWGVVFESGDASGVITITHRPGGELIIADFWRLNNCVFNNVGNGITGDKDPLGNDGAAVLMVGSDSQGGYASGNQVTASNVSFADSSLSGNLWNACYSQVSKLGYYSSNNYSEWVGCFTEDYESTNFATLSNVSVIGGSLAFLTSGSAGGPLLRVGPYSALRCRAVNSSGTLGPVALHTNGYNQEDLLAGWAVLNTAGTGYLIWRRTSDSTTTGAYGDLDNGWWGLQYSTTDLAGLLNYAFLVSDADTGVGPGWTWFPRGFYVGTATLNINRVSITPINLVGPPYPASAGTDGDIILNTTPDTLAVTESLLSWTYTTTQGWVGVEGEAVLKGTSVNAASVDLLNSLGNEIVLDATVAGFAYMITARVWAIRADDSAVAAGVYHMLLVRGAGGALTIDVDTPIVPDATLNAAGYTFTFSAPSGTTLRVSCAGESSYTVKFRAHLNIQRVNAS